MKPVTNSNAPAVIRQCAKAILAIPINEPEHRAKCAASLQQSSKLFRKVSVPSDRRRTARLT